MEWDTAAGHAVLTAAGGSVRRLDGTELLYGKPGFENPHYVARGKSREARAWMKPAGKHEGWRRRYWK